MKYLLSFIGLWLILLSGANATTYYTTGTGDWRTDAIWGTTTNGVGAFWSTITLLAGDVLVIDDDITLNNAPSLEIIVDISITLDAELSIEKLLKLTSNSTIEFGTNGSLIALGGGASSKRSFGGINVWDGQDPDLFGPGTLDVNSSGALPVELLFFRGRPINNIVELTWATATEENFEYFLIERSVDGDIFKEIARQDGVGESFKRVDYKFNDEFPLEGLSYYQLQSIDFDGYTEIFEYILVEVKSLKKDFSVFPNPIVQGNFSVQTNFVIEESSELIIYNNIGHIEARIAIGDWLSSFTVNNLRPGNYLFKLVTSEAAMVKRVMIN